METRVPTRHSGGGSAKELDYAVKRWPALIGYADSGHLPIDNNPVENSFRPIAIGKKNWLFAGSEQAVNARRDSDFAWYSQTQWTQSGAMTGKTACLAQQPY
ncbi:transposase [Candidatus Methylospira mobilis]|uniref:IS66 family transposase n=1 Tax=Candidatus Methylospira mobilis TaxID=1808979 RepID=UPI0028ECCC7E|nr:transposase [Candidatus Methylospira mobilis]WNV06862.1 transposase [Candidatus Methylospira mobilis]